MTGAARTIVVGVDGSAASLTALRWAIDEASARGLPLLMVHVLDPRTVRRAPYAPTVPDGECEGDAQSRVKAAKELMGRSAPDDAESVVEIGVPSEVLVRYARNARLLVLGHAGGRRRRTGDERRSSPALGWISRACVSRAACPVVVVPSETTSGTDPQPPVPRPAARALRPSRRTARATAEIHGG
jgi:nucleotide-binding universal stress UspA family protein